MLEGFFCLGDTTLNLPRLEEAGLISFIRYGVSQMIDPLCDCFT
jgi:hypothetical protein